MQKKKNEGEELYGELGEAFNFTLGDLEANRAGFLSYRQMEIVRSKATARFIKLVILAIMSIGLPVTLVMWLRISEFLWCTCLSVPIFAASMMALRPALENIKATINPRIDYTDCKAGHYRQSFSNYERFVYFLANLEGSFEINNSQWLLLGTDAYRVYFFPDTRQIISIEALESVNELSDEAFISDSESYVQRDGE